MEDLTVPLQPQLMMRFARAHLNSGDAIEFSSGITVIVGPNNVGKSVLLGNLAVWTGKNQSGSFPICSSIELEQLADVETVVAWCRANLTSREMPGQGTIFLSSQRGEFAESTLRQQIHPLRGGYPQWFMLYLAADGRANLTEAQPAIDYIHEPATTPLQRLWKDDALEEQLSRLVQQAFNSPIEVSKIAGSRITLHLGETEVSHVERTKYMQALAKLPEVHTQGHGLRSFVGMLLQIIAGNHLILLIDEPETFLHPPQARLFGQVLSQLRRNDMQVILATHSIDILQGLVDEQQDDSSLSIVRLTRDTRANINRASQVDPGMIKALSRDPLLRHSAILDGLFYHGTVLCEADGDATFYAAVNANIARDNSQGGRALDLLFTHTNGGYGRLPGAVRALTSANVPVVSVLDLDVLGNVEMMAKLLDAYSTSMESLGLTQLFSQARNHV